MRPLRWILSLTVIVTVASPASQTIGAASLARSPGAEGSIVPAAADAVSQGPDWVAEPNQESSWYGYSVKSAGDVNADGYDDVIVGAYRYDNGQINEGRAFAYYGSPAGPSLTPDWIAEGNVEGLLFGHSVSVAGDVNGDGYDDVIVGAPNPDHGTMIGLTYAFYGSATGLSPTPDWEVEGAQISDWFGRRTRAAGDVNGDGYGDVIVGAPHWDHAAVDDGAAFVYHGSPGGLSLTPDWSAYGETSKDLFGRGVSGAGDVNGDGYDEVIVGAHFFGDDEPGEGRAYVFYGSPGGLSLSPDWTADGDQNGAWFGRSVATARDVNGDGYDEVIVGAPRFTNDQLEEGRAFVYHGSPAGLSPTADWTAEARSPDAWFGRSVGPAGDVNADGYGDVIIGAPNHDNAEENGGRVFAYYGSPRGLRLSPSWITWMNDYYAWYGRSVTTAGDVNSDGYDDVIIGTPKYDHGEEDEGGAFVFFGSADGLSRG